MHNRSIGKCIECGCHLEENDVGVCDYCAEEIQAKLMGKETLERGRMVYHANNLKRPYMGKKVRREYVV